MNAPLITNMLPQEVICLSDDMLEHARQCSAFLSIPLHSKATRACYLCFDKQRISIIHKENKQRTVFTHSFDNHTIKRRVQTQNQHLLKAFKDKKYPISHILDVTAGWCRDSFILAQNQYTVTAIEQSPLVYYLTRFSLNKYAKNQPLSLHLFHNNALNYLTRLCVMPHAIYLDPMFPDSKHQAKNKKDIQVLQSVTHNIDMDKLFQYSLNTATRRVVVKRPLHSPFLCQKKPCFQFKGKTIRFDVYQCH